MNLTPDTQQVLDDISALQRRMPEKDQGYWARLGAKHITLIATHGIEHFKRTINFEYAQWAVGTWRHGFIRSLLWQLAHTRDRIGCLKLEEPRVGDPLPVSYFGRLISVDLAMCAHDLNTIASLTDLSQVSRVLEIGAGYGRMAQVLTTLRPDVEYTIVDIPPALAVSKYYLSRVMPNSKMRFLLPQELSALAAGSFDLAFNISSFDEMPAEFSVHYLQEIDRVVDGLLYLNGWPSSSTRGEGRLGLEEFPYPRAGNRPSQGGIRPHRYLSRKRFAFRRDATATRSRLSSCRCRCHTRGPRSDSLLHAATAFLLGLKPVGPRLRDMIGVSLISR